MPAQSALCAHVRPVVETVQKPLVQVVFSQRVVASPPQAMGAQTPSSQVVPAAVQGVVAEQRAVMQRPSTHTVPAPQSRLSSQVTLPVTAGHVAGGEPE